MRGRLRLAAIAAAVVVAGCSSDSGADPATTLDEVTTAPSASDSPTTSTSSSTSTTTTTLPPTTTTSPEQVKAEVEAAYVDLDAKFIALLMNPSLDGLDVRAAEVAVPGSAYYQALVERVTTLVNNGQYVAPNTPDIESVTVESVELTGSGPDLSAVVVACEVSNMLTMKGPDNPVRPGTPIPVGGTGELAAYRLTQRLQLTVGATSAHPKRRSGTGKGLPNVPHLDSGLVSAGVAGSGRPDWAVVRCLRR